MINHSIQIQENVWTKIHHSVQHPIFPLSSNYLSFKHQLSYASILKKLYSKWIIYANKRWSIAAELIGQYARDAYQLYQFRISKWKFIGRLIAVFNNMEVTSTRFGIFAIICTWNLRIRNSGGYSRKCIPSNRSVENGRRTLSNLRIYFGS